MKKCLLLLAIAGLLSLPGMNHANAQTPSSLPPLDASPMDMAYFPVMYPYAVRVKGEPGGPLVARVVYSRPQKKDREIFGKLVPYNKVWRLGANEATEITFFQPVSIGSKAVAKGRYTLYAIPTEKTWTIILNKDNDVYGAYKYDQQKDVLRTEVPVQVLDSAVENFTIVFEKATDGANLRMLWDKTEASLPIKFTTGK
ncbi:Protein of unknown function [Chitinophaga costaii]|uniref:DUF2911 domain-containing protein n=1 Tax=Chitinophaga costaii TaxID=1335309 RepID=A0A1C4B2W5_9BACT|nr:DUF2911 domain-containing protein [Chitinophaga costaii]PUZ26891.1 DUF2911 domain-containing protein [Chitinophaga costaii]SCC01215.1 Protein of unknown function [Chitinophaga costaii]